MKAIVYTKYGSADVLQLKEVDKPVPRDDQKGVGDKCELESFVTDPFLRFYVVADLKYPLNWGRFILSPDTDT
jgi:hypothetical protein